MVYNGTLGILATNSWTWIFTLVSNACFIGWTVRAKYTFWSATFIRIASIVLYARTRSRSISLSTFCIWSTWRWFTWILYFLFLFNTLDKRIPSESR
uniref:Uncharacterized protein n=1 Tax=Panstrongylus lignarius TaxID=156445 RepID=A0A224XR18_9HEMI